MMQIMPRTAVHPLKIVAALGAAFLVWGLVLAYTSSPAWAATITVNSLADDAEGADGECTLREAITSANTDTASGTATGECAAGSATEKDVINFALPGTAPWTVTLTAELPPLTSNIEIDGPGDDQLTVRRDDTAVNFRIFTVSGNTTVVTISGMTISNGYVDDNTEGGGILIADSGTLTVTGSTISDNFTEDGGGGIGIDSDTDGTLTVTGSTISGNTAESDNGGGIRNAGNGTVEVTDSTISNNFSGHEGGALANDGDGTMTITDSTMGPDNSSDSEGGGIYNTVDCTMEITSSTISDNSTDSDGGGIWNSGTLTVTDSTISGNTAHRTNFPQFSFGGEGGGIASSTDLPDTDPANDPDDTTTIINSTISGNTVTGEGAIGGGVHNSFGLTVIKNSTITNNTAPDGRGSGVASRGSEAFASAETEVLSSIISANTNTDVDFLTDFGTPTNTFLSRGYNLIGDGNATGAFNQTGDTTGVTDPRLGALADNGGPTLTHALQEGSPAIDKGNSFGESKDQRGQPRPNDFGDIDNATGGDGSDIGAFEVQAPQTYTVNSTADTDDGACTTDAGGCTLREAINAANDSAEAADTIDFALPGTAPWTVDLSTALPDLTTNMELVGPGADQLTVTRPDTAERFRIFTVTGDTTEVTISGMTISNGNTLELDDPRGGGISNVDNGTLTITDSIVSGNTAEDDGAIRNLGTLEVSNSTLSGNTSNGTAGGIYNDNGATATVSDSTFSGNSAPNGGGIFNSGGTLEVTNSTFSDNRSTVDYGGAFANGSFSTAKVSDSTFSGNSAATEGGAIRNDGTLEVNNSTFSGNSAPNGGGIWQGSQTSLTVTDSTFSGNSATDGAGIFNRGGGTVTVNNSTFSDNRANLRGGGIYSDTNLRGETTSITNSTISGNTAQTSGGGVFNNDGLTVIRFTTITKNTAPNDQGSGVASVGNDVTSTEVLSSIISANQGTDVDFVDDTTNTFVSRGYNLIGSGNATGAFNQSLQDQVGTTDPKLGALADNGGTTLTHALLAGSPAVDKGNTDLTVDQRGEPRPFDDPNVAPATGGDDSDIGAFEAQEVLNTAPEATDDDATTDEDIPVRVNVLSNVTDPDTGDDLDIASFGQGKNGSVACNNETGECTYTPNPNFNGEDSFSYTANDGTADSNEATVSIIVSPVNDAPSFDSDGNVSVAEDSGAYSAEWATAISEGPANESTQTLAFQVTNNTNPALFSAKPSIAANGTLRFTPAANASGSADITAVLRDSGGTARGGVNTSEPVTFTITINPVNDAPRVAVAEGGSCSGTGVGGTMNLTVADVDTAAGSLTLSATSSNRTLVPNANISFGGSGQMRTMTLRAAEGQSGTANITITLTDGALKSTETVNVKVGTNGANAINGTQGSTCSSGWMG